MTNLAPEDVFLTAGQFYFGSGVRVRTLLGTCVAITLWHPRRREGAICHYLLPRRGRGQSMEAAPGLYAHEVMQLFAEARRSNGTEAGSYVVKVFGGGHMFPEQITDEACRDASCSKARRESCVSIGCQNICAARHLLEAGGYAIAAEDVGGVGSRQIIFDLRSGDVWVKRGAAISAIAEVLA